VIYRSEGLAAFYSGLAPSLMGVFHVAVQFPLYERLKAWQIEKSSEPLSASQLLLCSAVSKAVASVTTYPHEVIRTRMQVQRRPGKNVNGNGNGQSAAAAAAAVSESVSTTPKPANTAPRIPPSTSAPIGEGNYTNVVQTFLKILSDEGWRGLYKGLFINLMRTVPNSIVTLVSYEMFMRGLKEWHER